MASIRESWAYKWTGENTKLGLQQKYKKENKRTWNMENINNDITTETGKDRTILKPGNRKKQRRILWLFQGMFCALLVHTSGLHASKMNEFTLVLLLKFQTCSWNGLHSLILLLMKDIADYPVITPDNTACGCSLRWFHYITLSLSFKNRDPSIWTEDTMKLLGPLLLLNNSSLEMLPFKVSKRTCSLPLG